MKSESDSRKVSSQSEWTEEVRATLAALHADVKKASDMLGIPIAKLSDLVQMFEDPNCNDVRELGMQLEALCAYEIARSERYGRCLSLLLVGSGNGPVDIRAVLEPAIRMSDAAFNAGQSFAIVMGDTDVPGIERAVDRFKRCYNGDFDLRYGVSSYPRDPEDAQDLISKAQKRLCDAKDAEAGAVVCEG